ncbi:hypothetical protein PVAP13_1NG134519 [Panicum virgatum]|uniref:Uncharacterized protein n=1 Tax=Panicum virgatum TaxID=38727 RepID=A0A8T0WJR4_PANVG|nr:hypothetical protein PVAP13_1NG134519 [Panicum virgatum]
MFVTQATVAVRGPTASRPARPLAAPYACTPTHRAICLLVRSPAPPACLAARRHAPPHTPPARPKPPTIRASAARALARQNVPQAATVGPPLGRPGRAKQKARRGVGARWSER